MSLQSKLNGVEEREIRLTPKFEESYWTIKLGATKAELEEAIKAVGPKLDDVVKQLESRPGNARLLSRLTALSWLAPTSMRTHRG